MENIYKLTCPVNPLLEEILFSFCAQKKVSCVFERVSDGDSLLFHAYFDKKETAFEKYTAILKKALRIAELEVVDINECVEMEELEKTEYLLKYEKFFKDVLIASRLLIRSHFLYGKSSEKGSDTDGVIVVYIEPGLAFGTGMHPTTQLCLEALVREELDGKTMIDLGTGSGILAIASAKLGASFVYGIDIDPQAVRSAIRNVQINAVSGKVSIEKGGFEYLQEIMEQDILVANLTAEDFEQNACIIAKAKVKRLILSGFLEEKTEGLVEVFTRLGLKKIGERQKSGWALLEFERV